MKHPFFWAWICVVAMVVAVVAGSAMIVEIVLIGVLGFVTFLMFWFRLPRWFRWVATTYPGMFVIDIGGFIGGWMVLGHSAMLKLGWTAMHILVIVWLMYQRKKIREPARRRSTSRLR